jgi:hypothetical protein
MKKHRDIRNISINNILKSAGISEISTEDAAVFLDITLKKYGMHEMFNHETVYKWETDRRRFPLNFGIHALFALIPSDVNESNVLNIHNELMLAYTNYVNSLPKTSSSNKSRKDVFKNMPASEHDFMIDEFSLEKYIKEIENAHKHLLKHEPKISYTSNEKVIKDLLKDKVPAILAYRVFANAGVCLINQGEIERDYKIIWKGVKIIEASIRLNPYYKFGKNTLDKVLAKYADFSEISSKTEKKELEEWLVAINKYGDNKYSSTIFAKYEEFLSKCGVKLYDHSTDMVSYITVNNQNNK